MDTQQMFQELDRLYAQGNSLESPITQKGTFFSDIV